MRNHVWRPLYVVLFIVAVVLLVRKVYVPKDFGIQDRGYMYGFHRLGSEADWKAFPVKYRSTEYCRDCHSDKYNELKQSPHAVIPCEDCHGPAMNHPDDPPTLTIDRSRKLCIRCHARLPYPGSGRANIPGIDPETHNPGAECVLCHYPHDPRREAKK